jgi:hypothetical protein
MKKGTKAEKSIHVDSPNISPYYFGHCVNKIDDQPSEIDFHITVPEQVNCYIELFHTLSFSDMNITPTSCGLSKYWSKL